MKTVRRLLKWLLLGVSILLVAALACWWLLPDAPLEPEMQALLTKPAPPPAEQNAYFLLWGIKASAGLNPHVAGQRIVAEHERLLAAQSGLTTFKVARFLGDQPLELSLKTRRCDIDKQNCLRFYQHVPSDVLADTTTYATYVEHYRRLRTYPAFSERVMSTTLQSPSPELEPVVALSSLVDAQTALLVDTPASRQVALEVLGAEVRAWRRILAGSDTLITQMIATTVLHRKYRLASEIMQAYPMVAADYPAQLAAITAPLGAADIDMRGPLAGELRYAAHIYQDLHRQTRTDSARGFLDKAANLLITAGGYQVNATLNQAYAMHRERLLLYAQSPAEIVAGHTDLATQQSDINLWNLGNVFYNPVGKILIGVGTYDYSKYAFRLHDLAGFSRLLELQRRILEARAAPARIPVMLANVGQGLMDPYTGQPMQWDAEKKTISFAGHGERFLNNGRAVVTVAGP